jgi:hypothetical protein
MILFTGDIVNTDAKEMHPWIETSIELKNTVWEVFCSWKP